MAVPQMLLETLEDLSQYDFEKFKSFLVDGGDFTPIPRSRLEDANQMVTVRKMIDNYCEEMAVNIAVGVLKQMGNNNAAEKLKNSYAAAGTTAAPSTSAAAPPAAPVAPPAAPAAPPPAAPASMMAQQGGIIFAPNVTGGNTGEWNVNINK